MSDMIQVHPNITDQFVKLIGPPILIPEDLQLRKRLGIGFVRKHVVVEKVLEDCPEPSSFGILVIDRIKINLSQAVIVFTWRMCRHIQQLLLCSYYEENSQGRTKIDNKGYRKQSLERLILSSHTLNHIPLFIYFLADI